ncbi:unnamed protein product [Vicia faba]|uniref:Mediator complex subunit 15 KIX domain-containing protein n=1 Tax=Vicia faba TaxID=3906 RepID=A0AAV1AN10_VICFA|nr:unnamed protein product [Vicia faba]
MDTNNGILNQGDWRCQLHPVSRRNCQQNNGTYKKAYSHKTFTAATSHSDYLKRISLRMLAWEIKCQANIITSSLDMETESQCTMANTITPSLDMETESQCTMANTITPSLDMEAESQYTMANTITPTLDLEAESQGTMSSKETKSQGTMANNMTSNQVGPINEPLDPTNGRPDQDDWRGKLQPGTRVRTVNKLLNTLKSLIKLQGCSSASNMTWNQIGPSNKPLDPGDWRGTLKPGARERIVNIIRYTLKEQLPTVSGQEGSDEFGNIAQRCTEN